MIQYMTDDEGFLHCVGEERARTTRPLTTEELRLHREGKLDYLSFEYMI